MGKKRLPGHVAHSPSARGGLPEIIRGAAERYPGGLRLGTGVALGDHPGKFHSLDSRRTRGFWEVPMCLGTRGHVAHSGSIRDSPGVSLGTRGLLGGLPEVVYGSGTQGQMSLSESTRRVCCLGFGTRDRW